MPYLSFHFYGTLSTQIAIIFAQEGVLFSQQLNELSLGVNFSSELRQLTLDGSGRHGQGQSGRRARRETAAESRRGARDMTLRGRGGAGWLCGRWRRSWSGHSWSSPSSLSTPAFSLLVVQLVLIDFPRPPPRVFPHLRDVGLPGATVSGRACIRAPTRVADPAAAKRSGLQVRTKSSCARTLFLTMHFSRRGRRSF